MQLTMALCLPRDEETVGLARHTLTSSLAELGVSPECIHDIELAISEACTNVVKHAQPGEEYKVSLEVDDDLAVMRIADAGRGFDWRSPPGPDVTAEEGRGIAIMRAMVDRVRFEAKPEAGTIVHLEKVLDFHERSPFHRRGPRPPP